MHGRSHRKTVCLSNSEVRQRCTPRETKGMSILSNEKSVVGQQLGRDAHPGRSAGNLEEDCEVQR